jgi:pimeloyl-ACP methyl ester carboxylesterase/DNA-binding winged helix-turn-helix (wHTH) protein
MVWVFEEFELDVEQFELRRAGEQVPVEPQVFDVLAYLIERSDRVVPKTEIIDAVWGDRFVSESALTSRIKAARQAVGDDGTTQKVIRTVFGRGYQFVADLDQVAGRKRAVEPEGERRSGAAAQEIRFCQTPDGARLAYAVMGEGPPLVRSAHWLTHIDDDLHSPVWRHWLEGLSRNRTLIRYDERGCGMSDHDIAEFSTEKFVTDLETVVDAAGLERFDLLGVSQGGPVAIVYAVRHPDRVRRLVLYGTYTQGRRVRARDDREAREARLQQELASIGWGRADNSYLQFFASQFMPDADRDLWSEFSRLQRRTTSAENATRFMEAFFEIDVLGDVPLVRAPTLILHVRGDLRVPFEHARELATLIEDSRLVPLDSNNHLLTADEPAFHEFLHEVEAFLDEG